MRGPASDVERILETENLLAASKAFLPSLNGLRALCVLLVFSSHLDLEHYLPGGLGVGVFFFISGFLITRLLFTEYERTASIDLGRFYSARAFRLVPALLFALLLSALASRYVLGSRVSVNGICSVLFYYANYLRIFDPDALVSATVTQCWSLSVEEHFYLIYPLIVYATYRRGVLLPATLIGLILLAPCLRLYHHLADLPPFAESYNYNATETRMDFLAYGCLATWILNGRGGPAYLRLVEDKRVFAAALVLMLSSLLIRDHGFRDTMRFSFQGIATFFLLPGVLFGRGFAALRRLLNARPVDWLGRVSYSFYLLHVICVKVTFVAVAAAVASPSLREASWIAVSFATAALLAAFSYACIERPALRLRERLLGRSRGAIVGGVVGVEPAQ